MKISRVSKILVLSMVFLLCGSAAALAAWERVGFIDWNSLFLRHPKYESTKRRLDGISDPKQRAEEERKLINPIFKELREALRTVCDARRLAVVMHKVHVLYGGYDVMDDVVQYLKSGSIAHIDGPADGATAIRVYFIDKVAVISQHPRLPEFMATQKRLDGISDPKQRAEETRKLNESMDEALRLAVRKVAGANKPILVLATMEGMTFYGGTAGNIMDGNLLDFGGRPSLSYAVAQWLKSGSLMDFLPGYPLEESRQPTFIGHIDPDTVLRGHPKYESIMRQIQGISDPKQRAEEERKLMSPIFKDIDLAIRSVSIPKDVVVVYGKDVIQYGGIDLTDAVLKKLKRPRQN